MLQTYPIATDEAPSDAIVTVIADLTNQSPLNLDPLIETIDPDALNSILQRADDTNSAVIITFDYAGYEISVSPAEIRVDRSE